MSVEDILNQLVASVGNLTATVTAVGGKVDGIIEKIGGTGAASVDFSPVLAAIADVKADVAALTADILPTPGLVGGIASGTQLTGIATGPLPAGTQTNAAEVVQGAAQ